MPNAPTGRPLTPTATTAQHDYHAQARLPVFCQYERLSEHWQQPQFSVSVNYQYQPSEAIQLPLTPPGEEQHQTGPYLATETALQLKDLAYQLKHRAGHQLLLHTVWRQTLSNKANSRSSRWYAGRNFAGQFDYAGRPHSVVANTDTGSALDQQIRQLEQQLQQARKPDLANAPMPQSLLGSAAVWQLDGLLKVYSDRMLFAEAEFNLRRLSNDGQQIQTFYSQDQTRLLLGEIHYLDHPYLGLVLQDPSFCAADVTQSGNPLNYIKPAHAWTATKRNDNEKIIPLYPAVATDQLAANYQWPIISCSKSAWSTIRSHK